MKAKLPAKFDLSVDGQVLSLQAKIPDAKVTALELLPVYQRFTNTIVSHSIEQSERAGKSISCQAGCGACCVQPIPVTELEAEHLAQVVKRMEPTRQQAVRERFATSLAVLKEAGLDSALREMSNLDEDQRRDLAIQYFQLKLDCPFLENQSCGIYQDRPLRCREYLVTSDPAHCEALASDKIEKVALPFSLVPALCQQSKASQKKPTESSGWMLMLFSLEWAEATIARPVKKHAKQWVQDFMMTAIQRKQ